MSQNLKKIIRLTQILCYFYAPLGKVPMFKIFFFYKDQKLLFLFLLEADFLHNCIISEAATLRKTNVESWLC